MYMRAVQRCRCVSIISHANIQTQHNCQVNPLGAIEEGAGHAEKTEEFKLLKRKEHLIKLLRKKWNEVDDAGGYSKASKELRQEITQLTEQMQSLAVVAGVDKNNTLVIGPRLANSVRSCSGVLQRACAAPRGQPCGLLLRLLCLSPS